MALTYEQIQQKINQTFKPGFSFLFDRLVKKNTPQILHDLNDKIEELAGGIPTTPSPIKTFIGKITSGGTIVTYVDTFNPPIYAEEPSGGDLNVYGDEHQFTTDKTTVDATNLNSSTQPSINFHDDGRIDFGGCNLGDGVIIEINVYE